MAPNPRWIPALALGALLTASTPPSPGVGPRPKGSLVIVGGGSRSEAMLRRPDPVRTGRGAEVMGIPEFQTRYPIPQSERDVAPGITQNPGY